MDGAPTPDPKANSPELTAKSLSLVPRATDLQLVSQQSALPRHTHLASTAGASEVLGGAPGRTRIFRDESNSMEDESLHSSASISALGLLVTQLQSKVDHQAEAISRLLASQQRTEQLLTSFVSRLSTS
jgi:hypothetical protein